MKKQPTNLMQYLQEEIRRGYFEALLGDAFAAWGKPDLSDDRAGYPPPLLPAWVLR